MRNGRFTPRQPISIPNRDEWKQTYAQVQAAGFQEVRSEKGRGDESGR